MSGVTDPSPLSAEPIIQAWAVDLTYRHLATVRCLSLTSDQRLSLIATPAAFPGRSAMLPAILHLRFPEVAGPALSRRQARSLAVAIPQHCQQGNHLQVINMPL
jgi:hypothetical protein